MAILIKVAAIAVAGTVLALVIRKNSPELALMLTVSLALVALYLAFDTIKSVTDFVLSLSDMALVSPAVLSIVFKAVGISIITKLSADVCRDAGQSSVASGVELAGSFAALYLALPLFETVITMIQSLA
ncbi:stage III sporulation protein AD [Oscillospiraceae bacterium CM]|nr:stage III sporulation protein AD [Oscillospiraceae bacterium CM]